MAKRFSFLSSKLWLLFLGVGLGLLARAVLGVPDEGDQLDRTFTTPLPEKVSGTSEAGDSLDIPLDPDLMDNSSSGLVPPIQLAPVSYSSRNAYGPVATDPSSSATFEPHGEQLCASGCSLSRHPTTSLSGSRFRELISELPNGEMDQSNESLETLLYFGTQTIARLEEGGFELDSAWRDFLDEELARSYASVQIRVVDENGVVRSWLAPTSVPLDRRHVFEMETDNVQPLVTSGTVKRVGLNHVWTRL